MGGAEGKKLALGSGLLDLTVKLLNTRDPVPVRGGRGERRWGGIGREERGEGRGGDKEREEGRSEEKGEERGKREGERDR